MPQATIEIRLCPRCANSIGADALTCPYCKADLLVASEPEWPASEHDVRPNATFEKNKLTVKSKGILVLGLLVFAVGVYLVGRDTKRQDMNQVIVHHDNVIQEKNRKIQGLEAQIIHMRKQAAEEFETIKARFDQSQRDLALVQRKLASAHQEIERLSLSRAAAVRPAPRSVNGSSTRPPGARPIAALQPRTYEALRPTSIYDEPLPSARIVAKLAKGTQVTVVSSENGWLEIRSKHGKPPGFIRADDAMFISRAN